MSWNDSGSNRGYRMAPRGANVPSYGKQGFGAQWDGFKRSSFQTKEKENGGMFAWGWKATKAGLLKVKFHEFNKDKSREEQKSGKNKGCEYYSGVLSIVNTKTGAEMIEPCCMFEKKDGSNYITSDKLGLIMTTNGNGRSRGGKVCKGAIIKIR